MRVDLSVIIPTYNRADLVDACLNSLAGSGVRNQEAIVVDDGSVDDTELRFRNDPRCVYLRQENAGPAAARNHAFEASSGRYVSFLDCDDLWLPNVSGEIVRLLDRHDRIDAIFAEARVGNDQDGYRSWIETAGGQEFINLPYDEPESGLRVLEVTPFFRRMVRRNAIFLGSLVMRREAFVRAGRFDIELCGAADWELWLRMTSHLTFGFWNHDMAIYTRHDDNMSSNHDRMKLEFRLALKKVLDRYGYLGPMERDHVRECLRDMTFGLAYDAFDRGETSLARARFADCMEHGGGPLAFAYWLACLLPPDFVGASRRLKHRLAR